MDERDLQMSLGNLRLIPPFDDAERLSGLVARVNEAITGQLLDEKAEKYPSFLLAEVSDMDGLLSAFDWALEMIRGEVTGDQ